MAHRSDSGFILAAAATLLTLASTSAWAGAITVSAGDTVVFTFDFRGLSAPQPPYPSIHVDTGIDFGSVDPGGGDRCRYTLFRDGNAVDPDSSIVSCDIVTFEAGAEDSGWLDGILSIALTVLDGSVTVDPRAIAFDAFGPKGEPITPHVVPRIRIVAEPSALLLVLIVALAAARPRRRARTARVLVPSTSG